MKKQLLLFFALIYWATTIAQVNKNDNEFALSLVKANSKTIGLSEKDMDNLIVSSTYQTADGIRMVYLQQTFQHIPVFNQMQALAFRDGKLVSASGLRIQKIEQLVNNAAAVPSIMASDAVRAAISESKLTVPAAIIPVGQTAGKTVFGNLGVALENITAELVWLPVSTKDVRLTWQVELAPKGSSDHWLIRVDASNAMVLDKNNFTVYEQFPSPVNDVRNNTITGNGQQDNLFPNSPLVVNTATYRVVPYPAESPNHPGGSPALTTDPWTLAPGNATSLKWHYDGTVYHDSTKGNNVWAQEDRDNNNSTFGKAAISTTAQPALTFDFVPNFTLAPTVTVNQQLATTNLFYWNNIVHDLTYLYGFDEPSGNFQASNQGRGGSGNDYVIADAQDAGGTNNANFSTPVDGSRPRMQMYLFTSTTPNRDGDLDNGVIVHEYGHGLSNRLTGGPANSSCLGNAEQGGEGWSDYLALMTTTNWATAQVTDGALAKPMGTYVLGQATTAAGIRQHPYSTNMSIDPWTYANMTASGGEVHTIGEIWCTALWEMTWEMILQDGINPNIFNPAGTGGNSAALKLVVEGMRLQPCSPGYIDARNAILKADTLFFAAKYSCSIWKAFAKRGMGKGASQGSSGSTSDQTASFVDNGGLSLLLTQNVSAQQEGLNVTYKNHVSAGTCSGLTNYLLTDTLPSNVTYVSGGTYNSGTRVVSFTVNLAQGASQDYSFTVQINPGSYFPSVSLINETAAGAGIPAGWSATAATGTTNWAVSTTQSHSPTQSFFAFDNSAAITDFRLATTTPIALGAIPPEFTFWHYYNTEAGWDGGVVEISTNGGTSWTDLGANITTNGYNGSVGGTNPIAGRAAFTGNSAGFIQTKISLLPYANQNALFRFRATSDDNTAATGWYVDDIIMNSLAVVNMRTSLFNNSSVRVATSDTVTTILPGSCVTGTISAHPVNTSACANGNTSFSITASGSSLTYQWQVSTDGGTNYTNIGGETNASLSLTAVTVSMNNNKYRCQIIGTCTSLTSSNPATLTVNAQPVAPAGTNAARCGQGAVTIAANPGSGETIDWYAASSGGAALLSGAISFNTGIIGTTTIYYAETRNTTTGCVSTTRTGVTATVNTNPLTPGASGASRCGTGSITISATPGAGETIDWYAASSGGAALLSGSNSFTTSVSGTTTYYAEARNTTTGCVSSTRTPVTATINTNPLTPGASGASRCGTGSITISATPGAGETIDWYAASSGGAAILSGSNSFTTSLSSTTTYYAEARNTTSGCVSSTRIPVTATVNTNPVTPGPLGTSRCGTGSITISATPGAGETIDWYTASSGGAAFLSGSTSFTTTSISVSTTYYAEARNTTTGCISQTRVPVTATVNANPNTAVPTGASRCGTGTVTISATPGAGETIDWYAASSGGAALLSGSTSFTTTSISVSTTYYAEARNTTTGCISLARVPVTATVSTNLAAASGTNAARCGQGTVTISATPGSGETIDWYAASSGGAALLSGSTSFTTPSISVSATYYAEARNTTTGCISATRTAVTATVNSNPGTAAPLGASRCGAGSITISATPGAGETIDWYTAASGGTALLSGSNSFSTSVSGTTTYFAEARNTTTGCTSLTRVPVTATVNANPVTPAASGASRCDAGNLTISATPGAGETIDWYAAASGGGALLIGSNSFATSVSSTTTYYAEARNTTTGCVSSTRIPVTATVNTSPVAPGPSGTSRCGAGNITISATPGAGETIDWYAASSGGGALLSGSNSYTVSISSTTTYYAQARNINTGCISATRTAVTATVNVSTNSTTHISICATQLPYTWNNTVFAAGGVYTVVLVNAAECDSLAKLFLDVVAAINIYSVTGGGSYTTGGAGLPVGLSNSQAGVNYQLFVNGNPTGAVVAGTGTAISFGNQTQAGNYTVLASTAICGTQTMSGSATITILSGPPAQFTVTGGGTYCTGGVGLIVGLAGSETGVNYQLRRSNGTINVGSPVAGTGSAISFGLQTIASDYSVLATNTVSLITSPMLNSVTIRIAMIRNPSAPGTIAGPSDACPYMGVSNVTYTINQAANATSYLWTAPTGASIIGSNTDTVVVIQYPTSFVSGTLSVVSVNACFSNATSSARTLAITKRVPSTPGTITPSLSNPCDIVGTGLTSTYTIRQVTYATGYTWTLSSGITLMSALGDTGIIVRFEPGFTSGTVAVVAYNNCSTSAPRSLTVTAKIPSTPAVINGIANVCAYIGQPTTANYSIVAVSGASSYLWTVPANATIISGQGSISVDLLFAAGFTGGSLTVKSVAACGSSSARSLTLVKNVAKPGVISASALPCPSSTVTYTIADVPFATSYIWSVPTNALYVSGQGTTSFTVSYKPTFVSGTVTVKSVNSCSTSAASSLAVAASECAPFAKINEVITASEKAISIYPNPSNGVFRISFNVTNTIDKVTIQLVDIFGKIVKEQKEAVNRAGTISATINAFDLSAGLYEVRYFNGNKINTEKIVIVK